MLSDHLSSTLSRIVSDTIETQKSTPISGSALTDLYSAAASSFNSLLPSPSSAPNNSNTNSNSNSNSVPQLTVMDIAILVKAEECRRELTDPSGGNKPGEGKDKLIVGVGGEKVVGNAARAEVAAQQHVSDGVVVEDLLKENTNLINKIRTNLLPPSANLDSNYELMKKFRENIDLLSKSLKDAPGLPLMDIGVEWVLDSNRVGGVINMQV